MATTIAVFDLDHTLINRDSSAAWWHHMHDLGWINDASWDAQHAELMREYDEGLLDMNKYLCLTLSPLQSRSVAEVEARAHEFVRQHLHACLMAGAHALVEQHRAAGHLLVLNSASEYFVVEPWRELLGFDAVFGVEVEQVNGCFTGLPLPDITYREGKVRALQQWLNQQGITPDACYAYSDSHNDLPLLEFASHPHAVNPNDLLRATAQTRAWPIVQVS